MHKHVCWEVIAFISELLTENMQYQHTCLTNLLHHHMNRKTGLHTCLFCITELELVARESCQYLHNKHARKISSCHTFLLVAKVPGQNSTFCQLYIILLTPQMPNKIYVWTLWLPAEKRLRDPHSKKHRGKERGRNKNWTGAITWLSDATARQG